MSIYAAGFNAKHEMNIAENNPKWLDRNSKFGWDASTTNGSSPRRALLYSPFQQN